jgi:hypothetical protein
MAASGSKRDTKFAKGFLRKFNSSHEPDSDYAHCRSRSRCGSDFGTVDGDVSLLFLDDRGRNRLLVVEREGSGPGNERNILKWYQAVIGSSEILLHDGKRTLPHSSYDYFDLCLYFTRPQNESGKESWGLSDFRKTVAYCRLLADLVNQQSERDLLMFKVHVEIYKAIVPESDWEIAGAACAEVLLNKLEISRDKIIA